MQLIHSELPKEKYLLFLKESFSSPLKFFIERYSGFRIGNLFYVIHHCEHQWDRKYGTPKNAALGFVKHNNGGCDIFFITFKGLFCPSQFLLLLSSIFLIPLFFSILHPDILMLYKHVAFWIISVAFALIYSGLFTLFESMTERSLDGENNLLSLLYDPSTNC